MSKLFEALKYAKTIAALVGAVLTSVIVTLPEVPVWLAVVSSIVTAIAVYVIPNATGDSGDAGEHVAE